MLLLYLRESTSFLFHFLWHNWFIYAGIIVAKLSKFYLYFTFTTKDKIHICIYL